MPKFNLIYLINKEKSLNLYISILLKYLIINRMHKSKKILNLSDKRKINLIFIIKK